MGCRGKAGSLGPGLGLSQYDRGSRGQWQQHPQRRPRHLGEEAVEDGADEAALHAVGLDHHIGGLGRLHQAQGQE